MENTTQKEPRGDTADHQVEFKQKKCLSTRAVRTAALLVGIFLAAVLFCQLMLQVRLIPIQIYRKLWKERLHLQLMTARGKFST